MLFFSGVAGLGYEIIWIRFCALGLGQEAMSLLPVLTAFFVGLGIGALCLADRIAQSARPARWYVALELAASAWGAATVVLIPSANDVGVALMGADAGPLRQWTVAFTVPLLALLPGTFALGATLPAIDRLLSSLLPVSRSPGFAIAGLYGASTLGAVTGTLGTTFWLLPRFGFRLGLVALAMLNLLCAIAVAAWPAGGTAAARQIRPADRSRQTGLLLWLSLAGFLALGHEVLSVRVMSQVLENTVYTFASSLSIFLLASALGAILYQWLAGSGNLERLQAHLAVATSVACLLAIMVLPHAKAIYDGVRQWIGFGLTGSVTAEIALSAAVFLIPVTLMGSLFGHLLRRAALEGFGVARAVGFDAFGAALAPLVWSVGVLPLAGARAALTLTALGYLLLVPPRLGWPAGILPLLILPFLPNHLMLIEPPAGGALIEWREGITAAVAVVQDSQGAWLLKVNDRFYMGSTAGVFGARRMAHIPLLLHPHPERSLFLGVGTGMTLGAAAAHPGLKADGVELLPEVVDLMPRFSNVNANLLRAPTLRLHVADARRYIRSGRERYDVIVADLFHPALDGAAALYTRDHFQAIRARLAPGGLFCQWLPLHQLDESLFRTILSTFLDVFPESRAFIAHFNIETPALGVLGTPEPFSYSLDWNERVRDVRLAQALERDGLREPVNLFGTLVANSGELRLASAAAPQTDDRPTVMFLAPRLVYEAVPPPWTLLARILDWPKLGAADIPTAARRLAPRVESYWRARDLYLRAEILAAQGRRSEAAAVLLNSLRASPDFTVAYARLYREAASLIDRDPVQARAVLNALDAARPERPEARDLLNRLRLAESNRPYDR